MLNDLADLTPFDNHSENASERKRLPALSVSSKSTSSKSSKSSKKSNRNKNSSKKSKSKSKEKEEISGLKLAVKENIKSLDKDRKKEILEEMKSSNTIEKLTDLVIETSGSKEQESSENKCEVDKKENQKYLPPYKPEDCQSKNKRKILSKLHPDKNASCVEKATKASQDYSQYCSEQKDKSRTNTSTPERLVQPVPERRVQPVPERRVQPVPVPKDTPRIDNLVNNFGNNELIDDQRNDNLASSKKPVTSKPSKTKKVTSKSIQQTIRRSKRIKEQSIPQKRRSERILKKKNSLNKPN